MPEILRRERLVPNIHLLEVRAPEVARKCRPGQFMIIMPDARGERIPLTIADWNEEQGSVTAVFMLVGTSTHKLSLLNPGDEVPVVTGPLGRPTDIQNYGTVVCAAGCFGIAAIYPIARALQKAGNRILTLIDVKANYLFYWENKFKRLSDSLSVSSRDSFYHSKEYIPRRLETLIREQQKVDRVIAIGCTYLMYSCAEATRAAGIKTMVSLNPIMVDGTGMCGACRVTAEGKTKFACVDGPDFDGHTIDWQELFARRKAYFDDEVRSYCEWERNEFS